MPRILAFWLLTLVCLGTYGIPGNAAPLLEGKKRLLYIRADFSDLTGEAIPQTKAERVLATYSQFLTANSVGKTSLDTVVTPVLRLPQKAEVYAAGDWTKAVTTAAETAAKGAGFDPVDYDLEIIAVRHPRNASSLVTAGSKSLVLSKDWGLGATAQGLGKILGVPEAGLWVADAMQAGQGYRNPNSIPFDASSGGAVDAEPSLLSHHYNTRFKSSLGWLTSEAVQGITASGIYTLWPHDAALPVADKPPVKVLRLAAGNNANYWLEMRRAPKDQPRVTNSIMLYRALDGPEPTCDLVDMTPRSLDRGWDAGLLIGRTFSSPNSDVHITFLGTQGAAESLIVPETMIGKVAAPVTTPGQVAINFGKFEGNQSPQLTLKAEKSRVAEGTGLDITATGTDADGDELSYAWSFSDGTFTGGGPKVTKTWERMGEYLVECVATDRKGGTARASIVVTVTSAKTTARFLRIKGTILAAGQPLAEAFVKVDGYPGVLTNSDGTYTIPGLAPGAYTVGVRKPGYTFSRSGFTNPLTLAASISGIDFKAVAAAPNTVPEFHADFYADIADPANGTAVCVVPDGKGQMYMFTTGRDKALWYRVHEDNEWSEWQTLDGTLTSAPTAVSWAPGRIDIFARTNKDAICHKWLTDGVWSGWEDFPIDGYADSPVTVSSWGPDRLDVFVRGADNTLKHKWYAGYWSGWESLGGNLTGAPTAVSWGMGRIDIIAEGPNGAMIHKFWGDERWSDWKSESLPEGATPGLSICAWAPNRLDAFTRIKDGTLQHRWYSGTWSAWEPLDGRLSAPPFAYSLRPGMLEVVAASGDVLNQLSFEGQWKSWTTSP